MFTTVNNYYLLFIQKGDLWSNIYNFSTMRYKCTICILLLGDYCKLTSREFHVKSMWRTTRESFPRKSSRNEWLKSYIKNYTENTRGINVDTLVILILKKKFIGTFSLEVCKAQLTFCVSLDQKFNATSLYVTLVYMWYSKIHVL